MSKKKTRSQTKLSGLSLVEQVPEIDMAAGKDINMQELSELIRTIIREEINAAVDKFQLQLDVVKKDMAECSNKVAAMEETLDHMESRVTALEFANESLRKENTNLKEKADRLENNSQKYNIRILGLVRDTEKGNPTSFVSALFNDLFKDKLHRAPEVENAHRVGPVAKSGQRAMVVRMHRLDTRDEILRLAKKEKLFEIRGMKLRIFPDFTAETAKARARFREVRNKLWSAGVKHGIIHPAILILTFNEKTIKFTDHLAAESFYKTVVEPEMQSMNDH
ncbi:hypothetical protein ABG768_021934 [Culter alburnus]|uniref:L1 transposable element RRM domain-containing protein n=1 Tax=Culter alburnus TaxID=194366 RepID=A0AAW2AVX9_CULAL